MSGVRGRRWSRRGKHSEPDELESGTGSRMQPEPEAGDFTVDIYQMDVDGQPDPRDRVADSSSEPADSDQRVPQGTAARAALEPAAPVKSPSIDSSQSGDDKTLTNPPIAQVIGPVGAPQIVVGRASPKVEPKATGEQYRSFPFRPDTLIDGWSTELLTVRGASLRGHFHRYNGAPRQDDFAIHQLADGRVLALVADGVSQSKQSHLGATAAVSAASRWFATSAPATTEDTDWLALMKNAAWALAEQARVTFKLEEPDPAMALEHMSTTLLCAVLEPLDGSKLRAYVVSVGDSGAWIIRDGRFVSVLGGKAASEGGISSSAVAGLPQVPSELHAVVVEVGKGDVLLLGTDGFGDPLGNGSGGVGNLFRQLFGDIEPPSLIEFARALDFSRETFDDDRTLIAMIPRASADEGSTADEPSSLEPV